MKHRIGILVLAILLVCIPMLGPSKVAAEPQNLVYLNQDLLETKQPIFNISGRTMMGYRDFFEATGGQVDWDATQRQARAVLGDTSLIIQPDQKLVITDGVATELDVPPQFINDHIYLPVRWFAETLGYQVDYNQDVSGTNRITLTSESSSLVHKDGPYVSFPFTLQGQGLHYYLDQDQLVAFEETDGETLITRIQLKNGNRETDPVTVPEKVDIKAPMRQPDGTLVLGDNDPGFFRYNGFHGILFAGDYIGFGEPKYKYQDLESKLFQDHPLYLTGGDRLRLVADKGDVNLTRQPIDDGFLVDISQFYVKDGSKVDYAISPKGNMGMLIDGRLIILRGDTYEIAKEIRDFGGQAIRAQEDTFFIYGSDGADLCLGQIEEYGRTNTFYRPVASFPEEDVRIVDIALDQGKLLALGKDAVRCYVLSYDIEDEHTETWTLPRYVTFDRLILNTDGPSAAFGSHEGQGHLYYLQ